MGALIKPDGVPPYAQIRKSLQDDIANNILIPGGKIPSEDELAIQFGVSRRPVRQGISDFFDEGLLYRRSQSLNANHNISICAMERGESKNIHI